MARLHLGIDLDSNNRFAMLKTYFNCLKFGETHVYKTRNGYHLVIKRITDLHIRMMLGDCPNRINYDEIKMRMGLNECIDTLFEAKINFKGEWFFRYEIDPLSEAFFTKYKA